MSRVKPSKLSTGAGLFLPLTETIFWRARVYLGSNQLDVDFDDRFPALPETGVEGKVQKTTDKRPEPKLPIFSILDSIDFSEHFVIIGDVGTGKSTVTPIREYELSKGRRQIVIREPSRRPATLSTIRCRRFIQRWNMNSQSLRRTLRSMSTGRSRLSQTAVC